MFANHLWNIIAADNTGREDQDRAIRVVLGAKGHPEPGQYNYGNMQRTCYQR